MQESVGRDNISCGVFEDRGEGMGKIGPLRKRDLDSHFRQNWDEEIELTGEMSTAPPGAGNPTSLITCNNLKRPRQSVPLIHKPNLSETHDKAKFPPALSPAIITFFGSTGRCFAVGGGSIR